MMEYRIRHTVLELVDISSFWLGSYGFVDMSSFRVKSACIEVLQHKQDTSCLLHFASFITQSPNLFDYEQAFSTARTFFNDDGWILALASIAHKQLPRHAC